MFNLDLAQTLGLSIIVLLLGTLLVSKLKVLKRFCIPAPVVAGILFSLVALIGHQSGAFGFTFDHTLKDFFMICFFATIGFGADLKVLKTGGLAVLLFLGITTALVFLQNVLGIQVAKLLGESPLLGLAASSIPMVGGHATATAYGPILEANGLIGGSTLAVAAATFGLISGSLIGGPTARRLLLKYNLKPVDTDSLNKGSVALNNKEDTIKGSALATGFFQIAIAVGLGSIVSGLLKKVFPDITFPAYIGAMLVAVVMRNIFTEKTKAPIQVKEIDALGHIFLSVFLVQALMTLQLWQLKDLALPLLAILCAQTLLMYLWATYVVFNVMGRDYDAAVLASGTCGFGLGATPNAMANMKAVVGVYGPSPKAFFILPIVGSLFIDIINATLISWFISMVS